MSVCRQEAKKLLSISHGPSDLSSPYSCSCDAPVPHARALEVRWPLLGQAPIHHLAGRWALHAWLTGSWMTQRRCCFLSALHGERL